MDLEKSVDVKRPDKSELVHVLLFNGGVSSMCAWWKLKSPKVLFIEFDDDFSKWQRKLVEDLAKRFKMDLEVIPGGVGAFNGDYSVENGNLDFLMVYLASRRGNIIHLAMDKSKTLPFSSSEYVTNGSSIVRDRLEYLSDLVSTIHKRKIYVSSPIYRHGKHKVIADALSSNGYDYSVTDALLRTRSCLKPGKKGNSHYHCGNCIGCWNRWIAFHVNGIDLTTSFDKDVKKMCLEKYKPLLESGKYEVSWTKTALSFLKGVCDE